MILNSQNELVKNHYRGSIKLFILRFIVFFIYAIFLISCTNNSQVIIEAHNEDVMSVSFSNNSRYLITGSTDGTAKIFDIEDSFRLVGQLEGHDSWVYEARYFEGDKEILTAGLDGTLRRWSALDFSEIYIYKGHSDRVRSLSIFSDGESFVSCSWDSTFKMWEYGESDPRFSVHAHEEKICDLSLSPDGKIIATASRDNLVSLWSSVTGNHINNLIGHTGDLKALRFSNNNSYIASAGFDSTLIIWDFKTSSIKHRFHDHGEYLFTVSFTPDSRFVASAGNDQRIILREVDSGKRVNVLFPESGVRKIAFSNDGKYLAAACTNGTVVIYRSSRVLPTR